MLGNEEKLATSIISETEPGSFEVDTKPLASKGQTPDAVPLFDDCRIDDVNPFKR